MKGIEGKIALVTGEAQESAGQPLWHLPGKAQR